MAKKSQRQQDNDDRTDCVACAISAYRRAKDGIRYPDEADFRDLLTDLMHYAKHEGLNFQNELNAARMNYDAEI